LSKGKKAPILITEGSSLGWDFWTGESWISFLWKETLLVMGTRFFIFCQVEGNYRFRRRVTHQSCNLSTTTPLVINRVSNRLTSPPRLIPVYETKNTSKNSEDRSSRFGTNCRWMIKFSSGVSQTDETTTINGQIDLRKTQNLMMAVEHEYKGLMVAAYPGRAPLMGSKTIHGLLDQIRWRSTWTESERWLVLTIHVDFEELLTWDHLYWLPYQISFPTIYGSSKTESERILGDQFKAD
jgi:hypothetical protein